MNVGLYGKLPSHGDFLRRRTSDAFVDVWDGWLQECMAASRAALGHRWLDVYLTSPAWRFACDAGVCGPAPIMGLMVPSVDRVGRYFPLALVAELPRHLSVLAAASDATAFFMAAERLVVETLEADYVDFEAFDTEVSSLSDHLLLLSRPHPVILDRSASAILGGKVESGWQVPLSSPNQLAAVFNQLLSHRLSEIYHPLMVWWTEGSSNVQPSFLIAKGLPSPKDFVALLDGSWVQHQWRPIDAHVDATITPGAAIDQGHIVRYRSVGLTDVGHVRQVNQDAFLERPEMGLWAVADGLGGHAEGEVASRMVCDALADFDPGASTDEAIEAVRGRLREVNDHLLRTSARSLLADRSGSTVVVLMVRGAESVVLWAGDSRGYRWRDGHLQQLTLDHSAAAPAGLLGSGSSNVVTRAVGVASSLELDVYRDSVQPGDRFLLCSDGLTRVLSDVQIQAWIEKGDIGAATKGLINAALDGGAPDNVTALIVEANSDE